MPMQAAGEAIEQKEETAPGVGTEAPEQPHQQRLLLQQAGALDRDLQQLLARAPPATAVFVVGVPPVEAVMALRQRRQQSPKMGPASWTAAEEQGLEEAVARARCGKLFCLVTT